MRGRGMEKHLHSFSKEETSKVGETLAANLKPGDVILLKGDLGAGKTTFSGGIAKGLSIEDSVISPTFNIMKCYFGGTLPMYHIDAYRLEGQNIELGLDEYIEGDGACLIEWPNFIAPLLPDEYLSVTITNLGGDERDLHLEAIGDRYENILRSSGL